MKLVVDSNVLFTFFWKNSISREIFLNQNLKLYSPEYCLEEIEKYANVIRKKTKISTSNYFTD
jgi:predicted nucleic acid-binding protein